MSHQRIVIDRDVEMTTRDGVVLRADVARPDTVDKVPAIVWRTPYNKALRARGALRDPFAVASAGFALVIQDTRGRFRSDGEWEGVGWAGSEPNDGYDCVEWAASQDWCSGRVGLTGSSYDAGNALAAARAPPPSLGAVAPGFMGDTEALASAGAWLEYIALNLSTPIDVLASQPDGASATQLASLASMLGPARDEVLRTLPLNDMPTLQLPGLPSFEQVSDTWQRVASTLTDCASDIEVPVLSTGGWFDRMSGPTLYNDVRAKAATDEARTQTTLVMGPWGHSEVDLHIGELGFGYFGSFDRSGVLDTHLRFFSRHLRDDDRPVLSEQRSNVRYFMMQENLWHEADDWPLPDTENRLLYLGSNGRANSVSGDGVLDPSGPTGTSSDQFTYDPADPVTSFGLRLMYGRGAGPTVHGPFDQARVESRPDVLVYTSEPLSQPMDVVGDPELVLFASTSAPDTDFFIKLCDVSPAGRSLNISDGMVRLRHRDSWGESRMHDPGADLELQIPLGPIAWHFATGHSVRIQITSSCFPYWDRNLNVKDADPNSAAMQVAEQSVLHSAAAPSHLSLPVPPRASSRLWNIDPSTLGAWYMHRDAPEQS